jgi:DNA-binding NarL/FixJ family response regulator
MDELPRAHNATSTSAGPRLEDLTPRERETLLLITDGVRNRDIAQRLRIGLRTVESHRQRLMMKLGVNSSAALTKLAIARGWIRAS